MNRIWSAAALGACLSVTACDVEISSKDAGQSKAARDQRICLDSLTTPGKAQISIQDCSAACKTATPDRVACGAMALAHFQSILDELGTYVGFFKPSQSPEEFASQLENNLRLAASKSADYRTEADLRVFVNQFLGGVLKDLRGIREGVYHAVGGNEPLDIPIEELPLDPRLLSFVYGKAETLSIKGHWSDKELSILGAGANALLSLVDLLMAHNLNVVQTSLPEMDGAEEYLAFAITLLEDDNQFLAVDDPQTFADAANEFHAAVSLLAGRSKTLKDVAQSTPGILGLIARDFTDATGQVGGLDSPFVLKLTDIDGDGALSRGDNIVVVLGINGEDFALGPLFPFGTMYPLSGVFTQAIFTFLSDAVSNMDGNEVPVHIAPLYNSFVRELGALAAVASAAGLNLDTMPDAIALDFAGFYGNFTGIRHVLPYWYQDDSTDGVNPYYVNGPNPVSDGTTYYFAFEREKLEGDPLVDIGHFEWATTRSTDIDWFDFAAPVGFGADGLTPSTGYYLLFQDPTLAKFLQVSTAPFEAGSYDLASDITTGGEFIHPENNRMTNAVINAMIVWWEN